MCAWVCAQTAPCDETMGFGAGDHLKYLKRATFGAGGYDQYPQPIVDQFSESSVPPPSGSNAIG